jgi:hypothetical protein
MSIRKVVAAAAVATFSFGIIAAPAHAGVAAKKTTKMKHDKMKHSTKMKHDKMKK